MKKLMMFAAAMTIVGSAFAQCEIEDPNCALVYNFKANVKTTVGKAMKDCDDICYRHKGSKSVKGYMYVCSCECEEFLAGSLLWFVWKKGKVSEEFESDGPVAWEILNLIGKKSTDAEGFWTATAIGDSGSEVTMWAAGFGKIDRRAGYLRSMSGNIVGKATPPLCVVPCEADVPAVAYPACDWVPADDVQTVFFGTWSISYNRKMSQRYAAGLWEPGM